MMRKLTPILGNSQRLDGGAMFGNVPKAMWSQWITPDAENRIPLQCRAMLIQEEKRNILFETGIGVFFPPKLKQRYGVVEDEHILLNSLKQHGLSHEQINIVVLSHLHFDHAGGLLAAFQEGAPLKLLFPHAEFVVGRAAFERSQRPHVRDRASFIAELPDLLLNSGRLHIVDGLQSPVLGEGYRFHYSDGHTPGMMLSQVQLPEYSVLFAADLIPGTAWVHLPVTMGYDRFPEALIEEKRLLLNHVVQEDIRLFYTHDEKFAISRVILDENGKYRPVDCQITI